jgi:hypothetical protein
MAAPRTISNAEMDSLWNAMVANGLSVMEESGRLAEGLQSSDFLLVEKVFLSMLKAIETTPDGLRVFAPLLLRRAGLYLPL